MHVVGGLPRKPFGYYLQMLQAIHDAAPAIHIKAFTAVEIDHLSRLAGLPLDGLLDQLRAAGLDSCPAVVPGIAAPAVRERLCPEKMLDQR
ncbi:MAG: hypothetical protein R2864_02980 [Syntrophotaleaceae bacterium]